MKHVILSALCSAAAVGLLLVSPAPVAAQQLKTVGVVSISGYDAAMEDFTRLADVSGSKTLLKRFTDRAQPITETIDTTKPWGAVVRTDGTDFFAVGFIPVTNMAKLVELAKKQGADIEKRGGLYHVSSPRQDRTLVVKHQGQWAYVADKESQLVHLPGNPAELLGDLNKKYIVAAQMNVRNIPANLRERALERLNEALAPLRRQRPDESDEDFAIRVTYMEMQAKSLATTVKDLDTLTIGWAVDKKSDSTYLDLGLTVIRDSTTAKKLALQSSATTSFGGFLLPGSAVQVNFSSQMHKDDVSQLLAGLHLARGQALATLQRRAGEVDEQTKNEAKALITGLLDSLEATVKEGKIDGGAVLVLKPRSLTFVGGGQIADGDDFDDTFKKFVALAQKLDGNFPGVQRNAERHGGVTFHTMSIPLPENDNAAKVFGKQLDVAVGIGKKSVYVAFGKDAISTAKQVIDESQRTAGKNLPPVQLSLSIGSIVKFAASIEEDSLPLLMASAMVAQAKDKDHVHVTARPVENGLVYRLELERGIILLIGQAGKLAGGGLGGLDGPGL